MIAAPAVDLRNGRCVQLVGGRPDEERVSLPDPAAAARRWWEAGFRTLHLVDLDAALGSGGNRDVVRRILREREGAVQVGGGIRTHQDAAEILDLGARRIVVGTQAIEQPSWLAALARRHPGRVVVALDVRGEEVVKRGWTQGAGLRATDLVRGLGAQPLAGILWTDVGREGRVEGIDLSAAWEMKEASAHPLWIAGGVSTMGDLRALEELGVEGAVLGMALYTGALDPREVAGSYGGTPPEPGDGK